MTICESDFYFNPFYYKKLNLEKSYLNVTNVHIADFNSIGISIEKYFGKVPELCQSNTKFKNLKIYSQIKIKYNEYIELKNISKIQDNLFAGIVNFSKVYYLDGRYFIHVELNTKNELGLNRILLSYSFLKSKLNGLVIPKDRRIIEFPPIFKFPNIKLIDINNLEKVEPSKNEPIKKSFRYEVEYKEYFSECEFQNIYK